MAPSIHNDNGYACLNYNTVLFECIVFSDNFHFRTGRVGLHLIVLKYTHLILLVHNINNEVVKLIYKPQRCLYVNPYPATFIYLHFQPLEVVSRYRDPQPQVIENYSV